MRNMKFYREGEPLFATTTFLFNGHTYTLGEHFDISALDERLFKRLFGQWWIGHQDDVDKRLVSFVESSLPSSDKQETEDPEVTFESDIHQETTEKAVGSEGISGEEGKVEVVEDSESSFKVKYKGVTKEIKRNQLRSDGTLTKGALALFE